MPRKNPQDYFAGTDFVVERTLYVAPPLSLAPSVYQDATHRWWAVRMPASTPRILSYADVAACEVVENTDADPAPVAPRSAKEWFRFMTNPMRRIRSSIPGGEPTCSSMVVAVAVRGTRDAILQLPFLMSPTMRESETYHAIRAEADDLRDEFLEMMGSGGPR